MKNKLSGLLAVAGVLAATSANAYTVTATEIQTYGQSIANYISADYAAHPSTYAQYGLTAADIQTYISYYSQLATYPASTISPIVSTYNSVLQTSACLGMGTASTSLNSANLQSCISNMVNTLTTAGYTGNSAMVGGAVAIYAAAGLPVSVGGASVPLTGATPTPTPTPTCTGSACVTAQVIAEKVVPQIQRATSVQQATIISNVVSNIFSTRASANPGAQMRMSLGGEKGMAAGNSPSKLNGWFNASDTQTGVDNVFNGNVTNALGGVDYMFSPKFVAGVSLGYDRVSLDMSSLGTNLTSTGWMVAPYASYQINDMVSVDGAIGYADGDADTRTVASGATRTDGYTRNFAALNLNGNYWRGDLQLTAKANYIHAEEKSAGATNRMEQLRLGGQVGYWLNGVMPYASLTYVNDLSVSGSTSSADKDAWVAGVGVNLFSKGAISGGVAYTHEFNRDNSKNDTFMANIGYRF